MSTYRTLQASLAGYETRIARCVRRGDLEAACLNAGHYALLRDDLLTDDELVAMVTA